MMKLDDKSLKYKVAGSLKTSITGKCLYIMLYDLADEQGKIQISISKLSKLLRISESAVRNNLHNLADRGYIFVREVIEADGTRKANEYILK